MIRFIAFIFWSVGAFVVYYIYVLLSGDQDPRNWHWITQVLFILFQYGWINTMWLGYHDALSRKDNR